MEKSTTFITDHENRSTENSIDKSDEEEEIFQNIETIKEISREILEIKDQIILKVRIHYNNNDIYEGEIDNTGIKEGWGIYYYHTQEKYEGFFQDGNIHGYGNYYFKGGEKYEGDWYEGIKHGVGILNFNNGNRYEGEFYKDDFDGKGTFYYSNGDKYCGKWKCGKKNGDGIFWKDNRKIIGEWINDELQHF